MSLSLIERIPKRYSKIVEFDGTSGNGAVGTVTLGTVTSGIFVQKVAILGITTLAGASATFEVGVAGQTATLVAQFTATDLTAGLVTGSDGPDTLAACIVDKAIGPGTIIGTVATAAITAGKIQFVVVYEKLGDTGSIG